MYMYVNCIIYIYIYIYIHSRLRVPAVHHRQPARLPVSRESNITCVVIIAIMIIISSSTIVIIMNIIIISCSSSSSSSSSSRIERSAEYGWKPHRDLLDQPNLFAGLINWIGMRVKHRGTVSSNSRFQTV